jgi:diphthine synthase
MLYMIGLGLYDESDISARGIEIARRCEVYAEFYTSRWAGSLAKLEEALGKRIQLLKRADLEENLHILLSKAKQTDIAVLVPGDPLCATTHIDLVLEARRQHIPVQIIHNASILSAVGEAGLQLYKYGRTATVPFSKRLAAVKAALADNKKLGLHTLLLLDIDPVLGPMPASMALQLLLKHRVLRPRDRLLVVAALGSEHPVIAYGAAAELQREFKTPAVLIVPGKLHFREREFLELL